MTNTSGDVDGDAVQVGTVGRDLNIYRPPTRSVPLRIAAVAVAVVVALLVVVPNLGSGNKPADVVAASSPTPPLASTPSPAPPTSTTTTVAPPPPVVADVPRPKQPPPTVQQQPMVQQQPTATKPANDGPGYLLPSDNDQKAIDFYDNQWHDAVVWDRHTPGTNPSYQPHWAREFAGDSGVFRIRNEQVNRCLEPVSDGRGDHVVANVCSGAESQLWRVQNTVQFASVPFGGCLAAVDGSYNNGNWLHITNCVVGRPDQNWRVVR